MTIGEPAGINPTSFWRRTITAAVYAVAVLGGILAGNKLMALPLLCVAIAFFGTDEFYKMTSPSMAKVPRFLGQAIAIALPVATTIARLNETENPVLGTGGLAGLTSLFYTVAIGTLVLLAWVAFTPTSKINDAALSFFGALYLGVPLSMLVLIREMDNGFYLAPMLVISVWIADSFAYIAGSLFGRHKLAPVISPKKSWEGLIAGTLGSMVAWAILPLVSGSTYGAWVSALLGLVVSISALAGDLFESRIKREAGVKDSGTLLPGHGGVLDRVDSMLSVSIVLFVLLSTAGVLLGVVTL